MKNSAIINFFICFFQKIAEFYNNSGIERLIDRICNYFKKSSGSSVIINFFLNNFMTGNYWRNSFVFKILMSPIKLLKKIGNSIGENVEKIKNKSLFNKIFSNLFYISLRQYGILGLFLFFGYAAIEFIFQNFGKADVFLTVFGLAVSIILFFCQNSIANLISGSFFAAKIKKFISFDRDYQESEVSVYKFKNIFFAALIAFLIGGFLGYMHPLALLISIVSAFAVILILWKTVIGVFLFVVFAPVLPTMLLVGVIGITAVSFGFHLATEKNSQYIVTPFNMLVIAFLGLTILSSITSVDLESSIRICLVYIMFVMAFPLIVNTIKTRSSWNTMMVLFILCGALVSLYGIFQNFSGVDTTQSWVDTQMFEDIKVRVYSTLDNPNVLGQYFILVIPVAFAMLLKSKESGTKIIYTLVNIAMFICLLYTWSRGAWVGVILALAFFVLLRDRRWLILCIIGLLLMPSVLPASILNRLTSIGNMQDSSTAYRVSVWVASLRIAKDYWMSGIGIGSDAFSQIYPSYALNGAGFALHSHNFYIQWVVEMGIFGLITFAAIILTSYKQITLVKKRNSLIGIVTLAMAGSFLGFLFQGMAENLWYNFRMVLMFWIYLGMLQSGVNIDNEENKVTL